MVPRTVNFRAIYVVTGTYHRYYLNVVRSVSKMSVNWQDSNIHDQYSEIT